MGVKAAAVVSAAALIAGGGVAAPANAAEPCWYSGGKWWCNNVSGAPVYGTIGQGRYFYPDPDTIIGYMHTNPSWFECKIDGQDHVGGPHPTRWEMTVADNGKLGYMKDTAIHSETNPLPNCFE